jgi:hypothetical protein
MISYFDHPNISQSGLKRYANPNPRSLYRSRLSEELYYKGKSIHFVKGELLDRLIEGLEIDEHYYIEAEDYKHPTPKVLSIAQECIDNELDIEDFEEILKIKKKQLYQPRWQEEKNLSWISDTLLPVIKTRKEAGERVVLTFKEFRDIATMTNSMLQGQYTKPILEEYNGEFQVAIYIKGLKCLIDKLQICHKTKVVRIIDFKTTGDYIEKFVKSIKRFRYDIQMSFYCHIVQLKYPKYKVLDPILIVGSTKEVEWSEPFTLSKKVINDAKIGWIDRYGFKHMGWEEMLTKHNNYNGDMYNDNLIINKTNIINEL